MPENANDDGETDQEGAAEYQNLNNMEENDPEENFDNRANIENDDGESGGLDQQDREDGTNGEGFYNPRRNIENDDEESDARIQEDRNDGTNDDEDIKSILQRRINGNRGIVRGPNTINSLSDVSASSSDDGTDVSASKAFLLGQVHLVSPLPQQVGTFATEL